MTKKMLCALAVSAAAALLPACQSSAHPVTTTTTAIIAPVSSSAPAPGPSAAALPVVQRFTHDIWPIVVAYNFHHSQGGHEYRQYLTVIDPDLSTDAWNDLRAAVEHLGTVKDADDSQPGVSRDSADGLNLASTDVTAQTPGGATLQVCYTFTALTYTVASDQPTRAPAAAQATIELHETNTDWYLHAVTDEHVVPNCANAAT